MKEIQKGGLIKLFDKFTGTVAQGAGTPHPISGIVKARGHIKIQSILYVHIIVETPRQTESLEAIQMETGKKNHKEFKIRKFNLKGPNRGQKPKFQYIKVIKL